jgi:sterol-4alpha-carboxylate 3-dehydrogenase (decarboxylating)
MTTSLVTGGLGFIGRHLVSALLARGDDVRVLDLFPEAESHLDRRVDYRQIDLRDARSVDEALVGIDVAFHNASMVHTARNRVDEVWATNLDGTRHVLDACLRHRVPKLVYVSSASVVYEGRDILNGDESLPYASASQAPYSDSKIAAEKIALAANGKDGLLSCAIRPHVVFGPGDARFMPALLRQAESGRLRVQVGLKPFLSDYTYVTSLVDALLRADERLTPGSKVAGSAYFITNGEPIPFWDFVRKVAARLGYPPTSFRVPHQLVYAIAALKEGFETLRGGSFGPEDGLSRFAVSYMCTHHYFSIEKARAELGYEPTITLDQGIEETCRHLEATGAVPVRQASSPLRSARP